MKGVMVELRKDGAVLCNLTPDEYAALPDGEVTGRTAHFVFMCDRCNVVHELGTWEEWGAVIFAGRAGEFSRSCIVNDVRGGQ